MEIWVPKDFARRAREHRVSEETLREAVARAGQGAIDAQLGRNLIKQRVARAGKGRSGGFRTIVYLAIGERAVFLHMFEKSRQSNLTMKELEAYREFAGVMSKLGESEFRELARQRGWREISHVEPEEDVPK